MKETDRSQQSDSINKNINNQISPNKSEIEIKKDRKKKTAAFKSFLTKAEPQPMADLSPIRKVASGENIQFLMMQEIKVCKICLNQFDEKAKICQFCKDTLCGNHFRKKRINQGKNKFCRICDYCEDKYLIQKHYRNQMKTQQSLISQELILFSKNQQEKDILQSKKIKLQLLMNKKTELEEYSKKQKNRLNALQLDLQKKLFKLTTNIDQNTKLQQKLNDLEMLLPPSFQQDYSVLEEENDKITKQLVKHEKMCMDAIKARCNKQKEMYQEYYQWQLIQKDELVKQQKKEEECSIY